MPTRAASDTFAEAAAASGERSGGPATPRPNDPKLCELGSMTSQGSV
jgi:hypothetical protein